MITIKGRTIDVKELPPHRQRVIEEYAQLSDKVEKLSQFLGHDVYSELPRPEKRRLLQQYRIMLLYQDILFDRIEEF